MGGVVLEEEEFRENHKKYVIHENNKRFIMFSNGILGYFQIRAVARAI